MKIKKCPHCDGRSRVYEDYTGHYAVQCDKCGIRTLSSYTSKQEAVERWNKRVNEWINPKDRLPDDDNVVLVIIGFSVVFEKRQRYATITAFYCHKLEQWITSPTEFGFHYPLVIAWQPIEPFNGWSDNE